MGEDEPKGLDDYKETKASKLDLYVYTEWNKEELLFTH